MKYNYIGAEPEQKWGNNKGVLSTSDIVDLKKEDKISDHYGLEFIEKKSFASNILEFSIPDDYAQHLFIFKNCQFSGGIKSVGFRLKQVNETAFEDSALYKYAHIRLYEAHTTAITEDDNTGTNMGRFGVTTALANQNGWYCKAWFCDMVRTDRPTTYHSECVSYYSSGAKSMTSIGGGLFDDRRKVTEIQFDGNTANSGEIIMYGLRAPRITENSLEGV